AETKAGPRSGHSAARGELAARPRVTAYGITLMSDDDMNNNQQGRLPFPAREAPPLQTLAANVARLPSAERWEKLRILEAVLFAASEPLDEAKLAEFFTAGVDIGALLEELQNLYAGRGVNLMRVAGKWAFRTAPDLSFVLERYSIEPKK